MKGYRESRNEMLQSYENFETQERRMRSEPRQGSSSGVRASRLTADSSIYILTDDHTNALYKGDEYRQ